jgi:hypothetical protein
LEAARAVKRGKSRRVLAVTTDCYASREVWRDYLYMSDIAVFGFNDYRVSLERDREV